MYKNAPASNHTETAHSTAQHTAQQSIQHGIQPHNRERGEVCKQRRSQPERRARQQNLTKADDNESNGDDEEDKSGVCGVVLLPANSEREHVQQRHYQPAKRLPRHLRLRVFAAHHSSEAEEPALQKRRRTCAVATQPRQHTCSGRVCVCVIVCLCLRTCTCVCVCDRVCVCLCLCAYLVPAAKKKGSVQGKDERKAGDEWQRTACKGDQHHGCCKELVAVQVHLPAQNRSSKHITSHTHTHAHVM